MKWHRSIAVIFLCTFILCVVCGCSNSKQCSESVKIHLDSENDNSYTREKVNANGDMIIYKDFNQFGGFSFENNNPMLIYKDYMQENSAKQTCEWYKDVIDEELMIFSVFTGYNGKKYVLLANESYEFYLYQVIDEKKLELCNISFDTDVSGALSNIQVLKDDAVAYVHKDAIYVKSKDGKEQMQVKNCSLYCTDGTYIYAYLNNEIQKYTESGKIVCRYQMDSNQTIYDLVGYANDTIYLMTKDGLYGVNIKQNIMRNVIERRDLLSNDDMMVEEYIVSNSKGGVDFYFVDRSEEKPIFYRYTENETKKKNAEQVLRIYSVSEDALIRHAKDVMERQDSNVRVEYISEWEGCYDDTLKKWNTELLSGEGADIYCTEAVPVQEYIEKGIFDDLSDIIKPMYENGELLPYVVDSFKTNDSIYTMAARIQIPIIYGNQEVIDSMQNLDLLYDYMKTHSNQQVFPEIPNHYVGCMLGNLYSNQIITDHVDEEKFKKLIELTDMINDAQGKYETDFLGNTVYGNPEYCLTSGFIPYDMIPRIDDKTRILQLADFTNRGPDICRLATTQTVADISYGSFQNGYVASSVFGMNADSKNKELAKRFIKLLLSEEVQRDNNSTGLPVNVKVFESCFNESMKNIHYIANDQGEEFLVPTKDQLAKLKEFVKKIDHRIQYDNFSRDLLYDKMMDYGYYGNRNVESMIEYINSKLDMRSKE